MDAVADLAQIHGLMEFCLSPYHILSYNPATAGAAGTPPPLAIFTVYEKRPQDQYLFLHSPSP